MPTASQIVRFRQTRREAQKRNPGGRLGLVFGMLISLLALLIIFSVLAIYVSITTGLPSLESIAARLEPPDGIWFQPSRLYDRSGEQVLLTLQHPGASGCRYLSVSREDNLADSFASTLIDATVATVDPTFWQNPGFSWKGLVEGKHLTLAQRLVLNMLLADEMPSLRRNIRERLLAGQLVSRYGHTKVIEWYLNSIDYGSLVYGADAAARVYFGKSAHELSMAEAAWLTAVAESPQIDPLQASQGVRERQQKIIEQVLLQGFITEEMANQATGQVLKFRTTNEPESDFQVFTNLVLDEISYALPGIQIERGGLRIVTTLDYDLQLQAQCVVNTQLQVLQAGLGEGLTTAAANCDAARLLPTLPRLDDVNWEEIAANVVVLAPETGQVLALIGQPQPRLDPAHQPGHMAGTLLTPYIYLSAFSRNFSPANLAWDLPEEVQTRDLNLETSGLDSIAGLDVTYHGPVRLRTALANDYLGVASQLFDRIGADNIWKTTWQFGMTSLAEAPVNGDGFIDFLNSEVTLLESVHALSVFSNLGFQTGQYIPENGSNGGEESLSPIAVIRIEDNLGQILLDWSQPKIRPIVSTQLAYLVTNVLSDETSRWLSLGHPNPLEIGRPAGVRLGSSLDGSQAWAVGFVPQVAVGTWLGVFDGDGQAVPALVASAMWNAVIKYATQEMVVESWDMPAGITRQSVCDPSGLVPTNACPAVVSEVFLAGNEPTQTDNLYQVMRINRETGQLATVFTPSELVDARVFLVVPSWAETWAEQAGLPIPPSDYDPIYLTTTATANAALTDPAMFAHVGGEVELRGSAGGDEFSYYRLQFGQGLNPAEWLLIGEDESQPVTDGVLGIWDTQGLQGLYVIQLSVVSTDQRVVSVVSQVTVDNNPPEIVIMDPSEGESLRPDSIGNILLQVSAEDELAVERIEFYLDGQLAITLWQPPYASMWATSPGNHLLLARAYDRAGNSSEHVIRFEVKP